MKRILTLLFIVLSTSLLKAQRYLPVVDDSLYFCYHCINRYVTDLVWESESEKDIYTKIETSESRYDFFRLTDSTYHLRKYKDSSLIEIGEFVLRKENIAFKDTIAYCNGWKDIIRVIPFVTPVKVGKWKYISKDTTITKIYNSDVKS